MRGAQSETLEANLEIEGLATSVLTLARGEDGRYRSENIGLGNVQPWSAQSPKLYAARVQVAGEGDRKTEKRHLRLGFRRVEIVDGVPRDNP